MNNDRSTVVAVLTAVKDLIDRKEDDEQALGRIIEMHAGEEDVAWSLLLVAAGMLGLLDTVSGGNTEEALKRLGVSAAELEYNENMED